MLTQSAPTKKSTTEQSLSGSINRFHWLDKIGIPPALFFGFLGVVIFMMGDGLESAWLQDYFVNHGLSHTQAATIFAGYGLTVAIGSWFSGVLTEAFGPIRTMLAGTVLFVLGTFLFVPALAAGTNYHLLLLTYPLRGFAYPLFAYSFLVVIAQATPKERLGSAVGWFWFCFTGGFFVLGAYYSDMALHVLKLNYIELLWTGLIFVSVGAAIVLLNFVWVRRHSPVIEQPTRNSALQTLRKGITISFENYKIGFGGIVRIINTIAVYGFIAFMPNFMQSTIGFSQSEWLSIWGALFSTNIIANLVCGMVADRIGWRQTIMWVGGLLSALCVLGFYYVPLWLGANYFAMLGVSILFGIALAGFVPLSALMPTLAPEHKGAALSVLNLGAGLSTFIGTATVSLFFDSLGVHGIIWIYAILYALSILLARFMTLGNSRPQSR
ncbi:MAG: MFS transporter [Vibrio sp.]